MPFYEFNSLPRSKCIDKPEKFHTYSLPRCDHRPTTRKLTSCTNSVQTISHHAVENEEIPHMLNQISLKFRDDNKLFNILQKTLEESATNPIHSITNEICSSCDSIDAEEEIFIDFKPRISPTHSPMDRKNRLQKTLSEGEILMNSISRKRESVDDTRIMSVSKEELKTTEEENCNLSTYKYRSAPIKDEGICDPIIALESEETNTGLPRIEMFPTRSISLENNSDDSFESKKISVEPPFPSCDSLAIDQTRDNSDNNWNESENTVLQVSPR